MIYRLIIISITVALMSSCNKKLVNEDVIGSWKSFDDAMMQVNPDSTFVIYELPEYWLSGKRMESKVNVSGTWRIRMDGDELYSFILDIATPEVYSAKILFFEVDKEFSFNNNNCWRLYFARMDKDESIMIYDFSRVNSGKWCFMTRFKRWIEGGYVRVY